MKYLLFILLLTPLLSISQNKIEGILLEKNENNETIGLAGANVFWLNASVGTITDLDGNFTIPYKSEYKRLVISYVGYKTDTLTIANTKKIQHYLTSKGQLDEVIISIRKKASTRSFLSATNVIHVSSTELLKYTDSLSLTSLFVGFL